MVKRTGPTNEKLKEAIVLLDKASKKYKSPLFKVVSQELNKPTRIRRTVNIYKINKVTRDGETAIIPGKVLSVGELTKKITVAAWEFSDKAKEKINKSGKAVQIIDIANANPKGKKYRLIG